jgi:hypothetical protein
MFPGLIYAEEGFCGSIRLLETGNAVGFLSEDILSIKLIFLIQLKLKFKTGIFTLYILFTIL